jgi:glycosyltransferase involved in cell wall biosynthesis
VIVPIYNEENTVGLVVSSLLNTKIFEEIVCVNDGSDDKTLEILKGYGSKINLINLPKNKGKGFALAQGIKKSKTDLVAFIDADFTNLSRKHIDILLKPL